MFGNVLFGRGRLLPGDRLDVVGGAVVATGAVQQRHGGEVLLDVCRQPERLENLPEPRLVGNVAAADRAAQSTTVLLGKPVDVKAGRTRQLVDPADMLSGVG